MKKNFLIIAVLTICTKFASLIRQSLTIAIIGVNANSDAYFSAFRLPDTLYNLLVMGTLLPAFIPVLSGAFIKGRSEAEKYASAVFYSSSAMMLLICVLGLIFSRSILHYLVPGFTDDQFEVTLKVTRVFLLSPIIFTASTVVTGILSNFEDFLYSSLAPLVYNIVIILGLIFVYPQFGLIGLAWSVVFGAFAHFILQFARLYDHRFRLFVKPDFKTKDFIQTVKLFLPRLFAFDPSIAALLFASMFGSLYLKSGQLAIYNVVIDLISVPIGVIALSGSTAVFPILSDSFSKGKSLEFVTHLRQVITHSLLLLLPSSVYMLLFREQVIRIIFGRHNFTWANTYDAFNQIGILSFALVSYGLISVISRAFYARRNTRLPVTANMIGIIVNFLVVYYFSEAYGLFAMSFGFAASLIISSIILAIYIRRTIKKVDGFELLDGDIAKTVWGSVIGTIFMGAVAVSGQYISAFFLGTQTLIALIIQTGFAFLISFPAYLFVLRLLSVHDLDYLLNIFKLRKKI